MKSIKRFTRCSLALALLCAAPVQAADAGHSAEYLVYRSGQTSFYADRDYTLEWTPGADHWPGAERYVVRISYAGAVVAEQQVHAEAPLRVTLRYPPVRPGVRADTVLSVAAMAEGRQLSGVHKQPMAWYSPEATAGGEAPLPPDAVGVVDLTDDRRVTAFLDTIGVRHTVLAQPNGFTGKWLVVSMAGIKAQDVFFQELGTLWQQGVSVLVLPPLHGRFPLPAHLRGDRVVTADEELLRDADPAWNLDTADARVRAREVTFHPVALDETPSYEASADRTGPAWVEVSRGGARLILCGWDLPARHRENPSAGLFVRRLLDEGEKIGQRTVGVDRHTSEGGETE